MAYIRLGPNVATRNNRGQPDGILLPFPQVGVQNRRGLGGSARAIMGPNIGLRSVGSGS